MPNPKRSHSIALPYVTVYPCTWWSNGKKDEEGKDSGVSERLKFSLDENILARVFMSPILTDSYVQHPPPKKTTASSNLSAKARPSPGRAICGSAARAAARSSTCAFNRGLAGRQIITSKSHTHTTSYNIILYHIIIYRPRTTHSRHQSPIRTYQTPTSTYR